eukprot:CAMPEP_0204528622 /NCGR_PEP_ID=MMETSP0661-20131031/9627_1 /ASSEMBLY_ACC=CAM_ASM_000606 /TAXON_ID=109239 /ORGANISM="Alexandrium margalefi, Strain AMGDE01CS-322" /LENGTH=127 /DNA_ID=CAMNT_0051534609 /DNA_START=46 /DNA_END=429 /DNA_ORIENTATION=+
MASEPGSSTPGDIVKDAPVAKHFMRQIMDTTVRIHISDGRLITGQLWCFDERKNAILLNCQETRISREGDTEEQHHRPLGPLVMVPGKHMLRFEAIKAHTEKAAEEAVRAAAQDCAEEEQRSTEAEA